MPYMVEHEGRVAGPYSLEELQHKVELNELALADRACADTGGIWLPLSKLFTGKTSALAAITTEKADTAVLLSSMKPKSGWFLGMGGFILAMALFLWRAFRIVHLLTRLTHH